MILMSESHLPSGSSLAPKLIFSFFLLAVAAVAGYLIIYYWTFHNFNQILDVSVLKNQITANQEAGEVKDQLKDLGYLFDDENFHQLNGPSASNYTTDVLGGYEPVPVPSESVTESGYYFYDDQGMAYYFTVNEDQQVNPDSIIPLMVH